MNKLDTIKALVIAEALQDAAAFADEFPGQILDGVDSDWDSVAWGMADSKLRAAAGDSGWDWYSATLYAEIKRLAAAVQS
jgi:hypothetical protein